EHVAHLMHRVLAPPPELTFPGTDIGYYYQPSMELSGDYLEVLPLDGNRFGVVVADVAGKGPDAAIHTAQARHIIQAYARAGLSPGETLRLLNLQITKTDEELEPRLITLFYGIVDMTTHNFRYACAGHEPALLWYPDQEDPVLLRADGILAGAVLHVPYEERVVDIPAGSCLVLYTDGITEARNPLRTFFGLPGLINLVRTARYQPARCIVSDVIETVQKFAGHNLHDDVSLLVVRIL
ncbi:MAG: PP2C family protein-serine/threonine phosphatase, partial [Candidatus Xenobia bacterium]